MSGTRKTQSKPSVPCRVAPAELETILGHVFTDKSLLVTALTHPTYVNNVDPDAGENNQRLEFLGDAVLGLLSAECLHKLHPECDEGALTVMRTELVSGDALAKLGRGIGLDAFLFVDNGAGGDGQRHAAHTIACAVEAVFGALWLDSGVDGVRKAFDRLFGPLVCECDCPSRAGNPKGDLQEFAQSRPELGMPMYELISTSGPNHSLTYRVKVTLGGTVAEGEGSKRRGAEAAAAAEWLRLHSGQN